MQQPQHLSPPLQNLQLQQQQSSLYPQIPHQVPVQQQQQQIQLQPQPQRQQKQEAPQPPAVEDDPYAPTPLSTMIQNDHKRWLRYQQRQQQQPQQQQVVQQQQPQQPQFVQQQQQQQQQQQFIQQQQQQQQPPLNQPAAGNKDPFAPIPLSQAMQINQGNRGTQQLQQQQQQPMPQQQQQPTNQPRPIGRPEPLPQISTNSSSNGNGNGNGVIGNPGPKHQKENLLMFLKVLLRYLEHKDPQMHARALGLLRECVRHQRGGGGAAVNPLSSKATEGSTRTMARKLRALVGEQYWNKANDYARHFLERRRNQQKPQQQQQPPPAGPVGRPPPLPAPAPMPMPVAVAVAAPMPMAVPVPLMSSLPLATAADFAIGPPPIEPGSAAAAHTTTTAATIP